MSVSRFGHNRRFFCFLMIFLCFSLTSAGYLSWVYHLTEFFPSYTVDLLGMVAGYSAQAAGLALPALFVFCRTGRSQRQLLLDKNLFLPSWMLPAGLILYIICLIPSVLSGFPAGAVVFGLLSNFFCGIIAACYLQELSFVPDDSHRGMIFGFSYGTSSIAVWLLSLLFGGTFLRAKPVLIVYLVLAAVIFFLSLQKKESRMSAMLQDPPKGARLSVRLLLLFSVTILLLSLVKNIGFNFPFSDVADGVNLELSRIFYAAGLILAGFISDKNRKYGAVCTLAALITPFIMLALSGETIPAMIFWGLDYFFFGFFSVFRVLFFADLASAKHLPYLAGFGLLFGRIGDAAGTSVCMAFSGKVTLLVIIAALLFVITVFFFFRLFVNTYVSNENKAKSPQAVFEEFSIRHDLSARERDVFRLIIEDCHNPEIAQHLFVSESTVKFHIHNLLKKTGCKTRLELMDKYKSELF